MLPKAHLTSSNQPILKEISPGCSLEGMMLMLKRQCQYFGHLMRRDDSLEKTLMLGGIGGRRRRGRQRMRWLDTRGFLHPSPSFDAVEGRPPPLQPPGCVQVWRGSDPLLETIMPLPSHLPACRGHLELNLLPADSSQWTQQAPAVGAPRGPACSAAAAPGRHSHGGQ